MLKPFLGLLLLATILSAHGAESPPASSSPTPALPEACACAARPGAGMASNQQSP